MISGAIWQSSISKSYAFYFFFLSLVFYATHIFFLFFTIFYFLFLFIPFVLFSFFFFFPEFFFLSLRSTSRARVVVCVWLFLFFSRSASTCSTFFSVFYPVFFFFSSSVSHCKLRIEKKLISHIDSRTVNNLLTFLLNHSTMRVEHNHIVRYFFEFFKWLIKIFDSINKWAVNTQMQSR